MLNRRHCLTIGLVLAGGTLPALRAEAQIVEKATTFVQQTGNQLVGIVNGAQKSLKVLWTWMGSPSFA
jgi:hypothetical protein